MSRYPGFLQIPFLIHFLSFHRHSNLAPGLSSLSRTGFGK
jgi:hypothetical protein